MKFPEIKELRTENLILRKVCAEDAPLYFERFGSREKVTRYMLFMPHQSIADSVETVENVLRRYETGRCYRWAIALAGDNSIIGIIELLKFDEEAGTCSFAYMIGDDFWGKGYGTQALKAALGFGFEQMELNAVEADHMSANPASGAVMRKCGMVKEGTLRQRMMNKGRFVDVDLYAILRNDYLKK